MNNTGLLIRRKRLELGLTQEELANKLGYKNKASIQKIETEREIPIKKLRPIATVLGLDMEMLINSKLDDIDAKELKTTISDDQTLLEINRLLITFSDEKKKFVLEILKNLK